MYVNEDMQAHALVRKHAHMHKLNLIFKKEGLSIISKFLEFPNCWQMGSEWELTYRSAVIDFCTFSLQLLY